MKTARVKVGGSRKQISRSAPPSCRVHISSGGSTGHVLATTHWRLNLSMSIGTFWNMYGLSVLGFQCSVNQFWITFSAGHRANAHAAFFTGINCHFHSSLMKSKYYDFREIKVYYSLGFMFGNRHWFRGLTHNTSSVRREPLINSMVSGRNSDSALLYRKIYFKLHPGSSVEIFGWQFCLNWTQI